MKEIGDFLNTFLNEDTFLIIISIMVLILIVLIVSFFKTKQEYIEIDQEEDDEIEDDISALVKFSENVKANVSKTDEVIMQVASEPDIETEIEISDLEDETENPDIEAEIEIPEVKDEIEIPKEEIEKPDIKPEIGIARYQIPEIKTFDDIIDEYESSEEENAVISTSELEKVTKDRMEEFGLSSNTEIIQKYEEEQEKKAIISYEQLLKNASNITISYKEEARKSEEAPLVNKVEVVDREVVPVQSYIEDDEFIKMLKEFRSILE